MTISLVKFIHLICVLGLLGLTGWLFISFNKLTSANTITRISMPVIILSILALMTGSLLVYPKHFTFHTPWIQAAYTLMIFYLASLFLIIYFNKKMANPLLTKSALFLMIILLCLISHDAVTKTTWLLPN